MQNGQSAPQVRCLTPPFRGAQQDDPLTSQAKSHLSRRKGEVMTRHHLYWNRTHKGRNLWSKANYFHRYSLGEQQQYVMTMRLSKGVWFGIRPLSSVTSVVNLCDLLQPCLLDDQWQPWRGTQMLSVRNVKITWPGKPWKQRQVISFFLFLLRKNFDQNLK